MRLAEEARQNGHGEQQQQPRIVDHQRGGERGEREHILPHRQQHRDEPDARRGLPACPLQVIVELRVLELLEIERRRMPHEPDAHAVGEEIAQQRLHERRCPREKFPADHHRELQRDDPPQRCQRRTWRGGEMHHLVDDELGDPQARDRYERAEQAQPDHRQGVSAMRLPHEPQQGRKIAQRGHALPPALGPVFLGNRCCGWHGANGDGHDHKLIRVAERPFASEVCA